jgi:Type II secretion system (T2SS), protein K
MPWLACEVQSHRKTTTDRLSETWRLGAIYALTPFLGRNRFGQQSAAMPIANVRITDLFTPLSDGKANINAASAEVLQVLPGVDAIIAEAIVGGRAGEPDPGAPGLLGPYRSVGDLQRLPELPRGGPVINTLGQFCDTRSKTFQVQVDADVGGYKRTFFAVLRRNSQRDVQILSFYWK